MAKLLDAMFRFLYGDDVFVSYAREDGAEYADSLASRLVDEGFASDIDQWGTDPGEKLPPGLIRRIRRCRVLVIVATAAARKSSSIGQEIEHFLPTGGRIVPVDLDGDIRSAVWWPLLRGMSVTDESQTRRVRPIQERQEVEQPDGPLASDRVVRRVRRTFEFRKKSQRLSLATRVTGIVLTLLIAATVIASFVAGKKIRQASLAVSAATEAESKRQAAESRAQEANAQAARAEVDRDAAVQRASDAEREANRQESRARRHRGINLVESAASSLAMDNVDVARNRLESVESDLRHWEWNYLFGRLDPSLRTIIADGGALVAVRSVSGDLAIGTADSIEFYDRNAAWKRSIPTSGAVRRLALSPQSERVAYVTKWSIMDRHRIELLDLEKANAEPVTLTNVATDHRGDSITALAFRGDGSMLASGSSGSYLDDDDNLRLSNDTIKLWHGETGEPLATLLDPSNTRGWVHDLAFSPKSPVLAAGREDGTVALWDVATTKLLGFLGNAGAAATALAFHQDGELLVVGRDDGSLDIWQAAAGGKRLSTRRPHEKKVTAVAFSSGGSLLLSCSEDATICLTNVATGEVERTLAGHRSGVESVVPLVDDIHFVTTANDRTARLWSLRSAERPAVADAHRGSVEALAVSPDGRNAISCAPADYSQDVRQPTYREIEVHEGESEEPRWVVTVDHDVSCVRFASEEMLLAFGDEAGGLGMLDLRTGEQRELVPPQGPAIRDLLFPGGKSLVAGDDAGTLRFVDMRDLSFEVRPDVHPGGIHGLAFAPRQREVLTCGVDGSVRRTAVSARTSSDLLYESDVSVSAIAVSPTGRKLACGRVDGSVAILDLSGARELHRFATSRGKITRIQWWLFEEDPDDEEEGHENPYKNRLLKVWHEDGWMSNWTIEGKEFTDADRSHLTRPKLLDVSGRWIANADPALRPTKSEWVSSEDTVLLWSLDQSSPSRTIVHTFGTYTSCAWSPDSTVFALGNDRGQIELGTRDDPGTRVEWTAHTDSDFDDTIRDIEFSKDGNLLATAGEDNRARVWRPGKQKGEPWIRTHEFTHPGDVLAVALHPSCRFLASGSSALDWDDWDSDFDEDPDPLVDTLKIWSLGAEGEAIATAVRTPEGGDVTRLCFTPDGTVLAAGIGDGGVVLYSVPDLSEQGRLAPPSTRPAGIRSLDYDGTGARLFVGYGSGVVGVWDPELSALTLLLDDPEADITCSSFSSSGTLMGGLETGSFRIWRGSPPAD